MVDLKNEILKYLKDNSSVSFVEIEQIFDAFGYEYCGNVAYLSKENENIVFWAGWTEEAFNIINELREDKVILMDTCELVNYLAFGKVMKFPVASKESDAKDKMCWLPVQFNIINGNQNEAKV
ncbi:pathogenicity island protein [Staphylococcus saprophyticus]|uniref:pathogenicity island protein n=1 Tax=Staphylococcus saprophyticus TaxID=29385 RepID=UPI001013CA3D|nr:pathogenicity island protein [Staphylococcus saprophyticus]MBN6092373.1 pathogenicity island protein [Staphylococcus saprophyticus]MDW4312493.1 pathogenicity island protein [Staphylococcus saprophyticus]MDW4371582.1 pathogenicity island protein [Staphylococcus saprophyticus]RXS01974.1 pathogenicity island protein [Staphylococcus saprophyticus]